MRSTARRGGPAEFDIRERRALALGEVDSTMEMPLRLLAAASRHQRDRLHDHAVRAAAAELRFSDGSLQISRQLILSELAKLRIALTPLATPDALQQIDAVDLHEVDEWAKRPASSYDTVGAWIGLAAAPIIELAVSALPTPDRDLWSKPICPHCASSPHLRVIVEESGEFMQGSPGYLICGRCATEWPYSRAVCTSCGEHDPRHLRIFQSDQWEYVRLDACETCSSYLKTFDLRAHGARDVVPLVDDLATLALDLWATERGFTRGLVNPRNVDNASDGSEPKAS
jgi:formate dehydrogenase accessory protein FdhE